MFLSRYKTFPTIFKYCGPSPVVRQRCRYTRRLTVVDARYAHKRITEDTSSSSSSRASALGRFTRNMSSRPMELGTVGALTLSVASSVSIVIVNKYLISTLGYRYVTFLTALHMLVTVGALRVAARSGWLEPKSIERGALLRFSILNGVSIGFLNLSLGFNSVGFYQMTKLAIIPCTVAIQTVFYAKQFSGRVKAALGVLLGGVAVATVTDLELNTVGSVMSVCAVVTTCVSQIWTNTMQKTYGVSSTQLLHAASPYMALTLGVFSVPLDGFLVGGSPLYYEYSTAVVFVAAMTCAIAVAVNFSTFLVIGKCDAVTYQVLGHLKTMLVLMFGFFALDNPVVAKNIMGIMIALFGMVAYGVAENADKKAAEQRGSGGVLPVTNANGNGGK